MAGEEAGENVFLGLEVDPATLLARFINKYDPVCSGAYHCPVGGQYPHERAGPISRGPSDGEAIVHIDRISCREPRIGGPAYRDRQVGTLRPAHATALDGYDPRVLADAEPQRLPTI